MRNSRTHQGFVPHFNRAIDVDRNGKGKWIGTHAQYDRELKSRGLERHDPDRKPEPKMKPHVVSRETRKIVEAIKSQTKDGQFKPQGTLKEELIKRGVIMKRADYEKQKEKVVHSDQTRGGFF